MIISENVVNITNQYNKTIYKNIDAIFKDYADFNKSRGCDPLNKDYNKITQKIKVYENYFSRVMLKNQETKSDKKVKPKINVLLSPHESSKYAPTKNVSTSLKEWLDRNDVWQKQRVAKIEYLRKDIENWEGDGEELVFRPQTNKNSEKIVSLNRSIDESIHDKLYNRRIDKNKKINNLIRELTPTFKPRITKPPKYMKTANTTIIKNKKETVSQSKNIEYLSTKSTINRCTSTQAIKSIYKINLDDGNINCISGRYVSSIVSTLINKK